VVDIFLKKLEGLIKNGKKKRTREKINVEGKEWKKITHTQIWIKAYLYT